MTSPPRRRSKTAFPRALLAALALTAGTLWWTSREPPPPHLAPSASRAPAAGPAGGAVRPQRSGPRAPATATSRATAPRSAAPNTIARDEESPLSGRPLTPSSLRPPATVSPGARVAIIVDDVGYDPGLIRDFTALGCPLTFSVLPAVASSRQLARACSAAGFEVMVHLPMEPMNPALDPGPGCITTDMTEEQIAAAVEKALADVPAAVGVNNHMGSRATADARIMRAVLAVLRHRGLFFVDSLTTGRSVARETVRELGVACAARSVFLDTDLSDAGDADEEWETAQTRVRQLARAAHQRGCAIGICHYRPQTARLLARLLPELREEGIELVSASQLLSAPGPLHGQ